MSNQHNDGEKTQNDTLTSSVISSEEEKVTLLHSELFKAYDTLITPSIQDDQIIAQFKPVYGQWELNDDNVKRIDPQTGETILHNYCKHIGSTPLAVFRYLIGTRSCDMNVLDFRDDTPIYTAFNNFKSGYDVNILVYLLNQKDVNVHIRDDYNNTLLHLACININSLPLHIFKQLIETNGSRMHLKNFDGNTPVHIALHQFRKANGGDINSLTYLLGHKDVNVNAINQYGRSLLHVVCRSMNSFPLDIVKYLVEIKGAQINTLDDTRSNLLHQLMVDLSRKSDFNVSQIAQYLIQKGVQINQQNWSRHTPLDWFSSRSSTYPRTYQVLIQHGAKSGQNCFNL
jgi:ankyrin repeat protein